jgi:hypothetical protein
MPFNSFKVEHKLKRDAEKKAALDAKLAKEAHLRSQIGGSRQIGFVQGETSA